MLHHLALTASDLSRSGEFYGAILAELGYRQTHSYPHVVVWEGPDPEILIYAARDQQRANRHQTYDPGFHHAAFRVDSRQVVERVGQIAQQLGARMLETARLFPQYSSNYFAVFFEDPDGLKLEVMTEASD